MATATFNAERILHAAKASLQDLEVDKASQIEKSILELMGTELIFGSLWWKTKRKAYREEAEHYFHKGWWPHCPDGWDWSYPQSGDIGRKFGAKEATLRDLIALCIKASAVGADHLVTLSSTEIKTIEAHLNDW